jgi:hypothetical protein
VSLLLAAVGFVLVVVAAGAIWAHRRQRQTRIPNLDPRARARTS